MAEQTECYGVDIRRKCHLLIRSNVFCFFLHIADTCQAAAGGTLPVHAQVNRDMRRFWLFRAFQHKTTAHLHMTEQRPQHVAHYNKRWTRCWAYTAGEKVAPGLSAASKRISLIDSAHWIPAIFGFSIQE